MIISIIFETQFSFAFIIGAVIYAASIIIALSPIGEMILRIQTGCHKIERVDHMNKLDPCFREVIEKLKNNNIRIPDDIKLYITHSDSPNAFATGRKTICVTDKFLEYDNGQISACLAHELGHIYHRDTDLILIVSVGNLIINGIVLVIKAIMKVFAIMFGMFGLVGGPVGAMAAAIVNSFVLIMNYFINGIMWVWSKLGMELVLKSNRDNEYEADKFSFNAGYGKELCELLDSIKQPEEKGLFANLANSHPASDSRIAALQKLGVPYNTKHNG